MAMMSEAFVKSRIGRVLFTTLVIIVTLGKLPFWLVFAIPPRWRQHPQWSYRQAISQRLMRVFIHTWSVMEITTPMRFEPAAEKERFVVLQAGGKQLYRGVLANEKVLPTAVGATWFPECYKSATRSEDAKEKRIVLYFHGGAYVMGEGRSLDASFPCTNYATILDAHVLSVSYRLACNPDCQFPAALQDAVTAYDFLLNQEHVPADKIIVAGDSCGANLAIALLRYIADTKGLLPSPAAALLCSPWVDLASSLEPSRLERHRNYPMDYLPSNFTAWGARVYLPPGADATGPYFSPIAHPFVSQTPIFVCVGGQETLYDSGVQFAQQMAAAAAGGEGDVKIHVEPWATHAFVMIGNMIGFEDAARQSIRAAKEWLEQRRKGE